MIKNQYGKTIKEWMSDAGGEYKSTAFLKALNEQGIKVLQSAPHTPQQNGHTERFNRTIMDKAEAMRHEACPPDSWWEFTVEQAIHLYNHTSMACLNNETPFYRMEGGIPDMSHLKVFGCAAYVFLPLEIRKDKLSPKSKLMTYLGIEQGLKVHRFMCSSNRLFYVPKALFDEEYFPWCKIQSQRQTMHLNKPINEQPRHQEIDDTAPPAPLPANPWDNLDGYRPNPPIPPRPSQPAPRPPTTPHKPTQQAGIPTPPLQRMRPGVALDSPPLLRMQLNPAPTRGSGLQQSGRRPSPPPLAGPSRPPQCPQMQQRPRTPPSPSGGPRRSERLRRVPTCPGNVYGEQRHPTDIERDMRCTQMWREMTEEQHRSRSTSSCSDHFQETNPGPSPPHSSNDPDQSLGERSEGSDDGSQSAKSVDEVEETLSYLAKHGGVRYLNTLLATAVPPGSEIPDTCNIHEWTFKDIMHMPSVQQKDWIDACCQELNSL